MGDRRVMDTEMFWEDGGWGDVVGEKCKDL